jgi:hypothetical protein
MWWLERLMSVGSPRPRFSTRAREMGLVGVYDRKTGRTWGIREVLDSGSAEFASCGLTIKERQQAIVDIGFEDCVRSLDKCFKILGKPYDARESVLGVLSRDD